MTKKFDFVSELKEHEFRKLDEDPVCGFLWLERKCETPCGDLFVTVMICSGCCRIFYSYDGQIQRAFKTKVSLLDRHAVAGIRSALECRDVKY